LRLEADGLDGLALTTLGRVSSESGHIKLLVDAGWRGGSKLEVGILSRRLR
jgi:hypothetical protein